MYEEEVKTCEKYITGRIAEIARKIEEKKSSLTDFCCFHITLYNTIVNAKKDWSPPLLI